MHRINITAIVVVGLLGLTAGPAAAQPDERVGQAPPESDTGRPADMPAVSTEVDGVLTRQGRIVLEPSFQYIHSSANRLTFKGIQIIRPLLIGVFAAEAVDRNIFTAALTARLGITNRFELEVKVPYVYRNSSENTTVPITQTNGKFVLDQDVSGDGLGDIEVAMHYQFNDGDIGAYFVGNLRVKTVTGEGPFDVERTATGVATELPTGSGFYSIEPSLTVLFPSSPAVYFANIGYVFNLEDDINERIGDRTIGTVDPGDAVRFSFGMAYAINRKTSFTIGYKHAYIMATETEFLTPNPVTVESRTLTVGALLLGWAYQVDDNLAINLNLELGVTDDASDTVLTLRLPFGIDAF